MLLAELTEVAVKHVLSHWHPSRREKGKEGGRGVIDAHAIRVRGRRRSSDRSIAIGRSDIGAKLIPSSSFSFSREIMRDFFLP